MHILRLLGFCMLTYIKKWKTQQLLNTYFIAYKYYIKHTDLCWRGGLIRNLYKTSLEKL